MCTIIKDIIFVFFPMAEKTLKSKYVNGDIDTVSEMHLVGLMCNEMLQSILEIRCTYLH